MLTIEPTGAVLGGAVHGIENDLLIWDHLGTQHRVIADYGPNAIRLIRRCQVMATNVFVPEFLRPARELTAAGAA